MGATTITPPKPKAGRTTAEGGRGHGGFGDGGFGGEAWPRQVPPQAYRTGIWLALVAITMLFAAFTSALVVRQGISNDWVHLRLPWILWLNTAVLLASSLTLEIARRALAAGFPERFLQAWYGTTGLGLAFLAGQLVAWRELASRGVYLATSPNSSFFYLLTAAHGVHLFGGVLALLYVAFRAGRLATGSARPVAVEVASIYWHFMDGLWIYVLVLLAWRL